MSRCLYNTHASLKLFHLHLAVTPFHLLAVRLIMASPSPHASFLQDASDPLTRQFLAQDCHDTPEQRTHRETANIEAVKRSKEIDQWLRAEKSAQQKMVRKQRVVRIILVGMSRLVAISRHVHFSFSSRPIRIWKVNYDQKLSTPICSSVLLGRTRNMEKSHSPQPCPIDSSDS